MRSRRNLFLAVGVALSAIVSIATIASPQAKANSPFLQTVPSPSQSVVPLTPTADPTPPPPIGQSQEAQRALVYIAQREHIPIEHLSITGEFQQDSGLLGRSFQAITIQDRREEGGFFKVLVDRQTLQVEDRAQVEAMERQAHSARYGKLQPALYERLQQLQDTDLVTVTIVLADNPGQSLAEREASARSSLAVKYPEARAAIERGGQPMDVDDQALAEKIYQEYVALLDAGLPQRLQPLIDALSAQRFAAKTYVSLPAITVRLPKRVIQVVSARDDVGTIFLMDDRAGQSALSTSGHTNRVPSVWIRGVDGRLGDGSGVKIAIAEDNNVDFSANSGLCPAGTNNCFRYPGAVRPAYKGQSNGHATWVASTAASNNATYKGMAPGATIMSAGMYGSFQQDLTDSVEWALDNGADIVNTSYGWCGAPYSVEIDWAYDYLALARRRLLVNAAGNNNNLGCEGNNNVISPGLGWNVLTVGASNDGESPDWSNDSMGFLSAYQNPWVQFTTQGDREKPEVVAPGIQITGISLDGTPTTGNGTSLAAPQVAGEAALLIDRSPQLRNWPEALRAIIMATAIHNIDGPTGIVPGSDLRDGAGGINATLAHATASAGPYTSATTCSGPCWWAESITSGSFNGSGERYYYFRAQAGDRIRVAIAWAAYAQCGGTGGSGAGGVAVAFVPIYECYTQLASDLDLRIIAPNGGELIDGVSNSWYNSYELAPKDGQLVLPQTGTYKIVVRRYTFTDDSNYLAVAWIKDATYLPELRNRNDWVSEIYLRNHGAVARYVTVSYFNADGTPTPKVSDSCYLLPNMWCWLPMNYDNRIPSGTIGSAIVAGGEDVTVMVRRNKSSKTELTSYTDILPNSSSGSYGWEQASSTLYAPSLKRGYAGRSSAIQITNGGTLVTSVYVDLYSDTGATRTIGPYTLNPHGQTAIRASDGSGSGGCSLSNTICSGRIYSSNGQPLAAVVEEYNDADGLAVTTHNVFSSGNPTIYFPLVKNALSNMSTAFHVQNVGGSGASITANFYRQDGTQVAGCSPSLYAPSRSAVIFYNLTCLGNGFLGSAVFSASQPLVGMANETSADGRHKKGYSSFQAGSRVAYGPLVYRTYVDGPTWDSSVTVQNLSTQGANVMLTYYNSGGSVVGSQNVVLAGRGSGVYSSPASGLKGSVVIAANQDIAAVIHIVNNATTGDSHEIYNASHR